MNGRLWTADEVRLLHELYPHRPTRIVAQAIGRGTGNVYAKAKQLGLRKTAEFLASADSGRLEKGQTRPGTERTQFPKGHIPANKGLRRPGWSAGRMKETQFKRGQRTGKAASNWKPIGTILPDTNGYLRIKVREAVHGEAYGFGNSKVWPLLNRVVWEHHYGAIPPRHLVMFRDGNRTNCAVENLELVSMAENARRNRMWTKFPRELAETIQLQAQLTKKIRRLSGKKQDQRSA